MLFHLPGPPFLLLFTYLSFRFRSNLVDPQSRSDSQSWVIKRKTFERSSKEKKRKDKLDEIPGSIPGFLDQNIKG